MVSAKPSLNVYDCFTTLFSSFKCIKNFCILVLDSNDIKMKIRTLFSTKMEWMLPDINVLNRTGKGEI
jgi:hypothetical protein